MCYRLSLILLLVLNFPTIAFAHDTGFATLRIIRINSAEWAFEVKTPLYGLDQSMRRFNATNPDSLKNLVVGSKKYKELIVAYIKEAFDVMAWTAAIDGGAQSQSTKLTLGQGRIQLNNHLSTLIFQIKGVPKEMDKLAIQLPYMSGNKSQHNVLRLIDGKRKKRYTLSATNDFSVNDIEFFKVH